MPLRADAGSDRRVSTATRPAAADLHTLATALIDGVEENGRLPTLKQKMTLQDLEALAGLVLGRLRLAPPAAAAAVEAEKWGRDVDTLARLVENTRPVLESETATPAELAEALRLMREALPCTPERWAMHGLLERGVRAASSSDSILDQHLTLRHTRRMLHTMLVTHESRTAQVLVAEYTKPNVIELLGRVGPPTSASERAQLDSIMQLPVPTIYNVVAKAHPEVSELSWRAVAAVPPANERQEARRCLLLIDVLLNAMGEPPLEQARRVFEKLIAPMKTRFAAHQDDETRARDVGDVQHFLAAMAELVPHHHRSARVVWRAIDLADRKRDGSLDDAYIVAIDALGAALAAH